MKINFLKQRFRDDRKEHKKETKPGCIVRVLLTVVLCLIIPIAVFYITEWITHNPVSDIFEGAIYLNIILFEIILLLLFSVFGSARVALLIETIFFTLYALTNYYVISFRSSPVLPWDVYSINTAKSVADNYSYVLPWEVVFKLVLVCFLLIIITKIRIKIPFLKFWYLRIGLIIISLCLCTIFVSKVHDKKFTTKMHLYKVLVDSGNFYRKNGGPLAFIMQCKYLVGEKPEGYSKEEVEREILDYTTNDEAINNTEDYPNIIVIMNEAFSDVSILADFETNVDYMPYVRSLQDSPDAITGNLSVSVLGGSTANTEFEFLTGNTMAFLPTGTIPYQQYIRKEIPCLPAYLKSLGYHTYASHPYKATGWARNRVYQLLQFEEMTFLSSYADAEHIRTYVSDAACNSHIIESFEKNKETNQPFFMFLVTMQNHGSYTKEYENFVPDVTVKGSDSFALSNYLSLIKQSDIAIEELIEYFSKVDEKTVIVMFGDHQPADSVINDIYTINGINKKKLSKEEKSLRYKVPFVIWNNYHSPLFGEHGIETSANYLATRVLESAELPLSPYFSFLKEEQELIPVITSQVVVDSNGEFSTLEDQKDILLKYQYFQYYNLFE